MSKFAEAIQKQEAVVVAAQAKLADLIKAAAAALLTADVGPGYSVSFKIGRAETRREVVGIVRGRGIVKDVDSVRAEVGEGFDLEVYTIPVSQLLSITKPEAQPSAIAVALGTAAAGESEAPSADLSALTDEVKTEADLLLEDLNG